MPSNRLLLTEFKGTPRQCGAAYGEAFALAIMGFAKLGVDPTRSRLSYARRCWKHVEQSAPTSAAFLAGLAAGAGVSRDLATLVTLHEEIHHQPHCTAFVAGGAATRDGQTIIGQNWDWPPQLYPWPGLLRLNMRGRPRCVTYHFPGLWACAGINEAGMSLLWTGGGYYPSVPPVVGVPTYVLIAEILQLPSVDAALEYLARVEHAGSFIFFLADAGGEAAVVEAVPKKISVDRSAKPLSRANHYVCPEMVRCSRQVKPSRRTTTTLQRAKRMAALMRQHSRRLTPAIAKKILTDRQGDWPWLHQFPGGPRAEQLEGMTIDSFFALPQEPAFWTCRGGRTPGPWQNVSP